MLHSETKGTAIVASTVRMPRDMRDELKIQAIKAGRSYNAHALTILEAGLRQNEEDRQGGNPDGLV